MSGFFESFNRMSKVERFGTLYLSIIIIVVALSLIFFEPVYNRIYPPVNHTRGFDSVLHIVEEEYREKQRRDSITKAERMNRHKSNRNYRYTKKEDTSRSERFYFNPNTLTADSFELLGFKPFVAANIEKYRAAGGNFKSAKDLEKIYEINDELVTELSSFMIFPDEYDEFEQSGYEKQDDADGFYGSDQEENKYETDKQAYEKSEVTFYEFDLNTADTSDLKKIKGIGSYYAGNILKYRELLGGYVDVEQLTEVYGISDSLYQSIALHFHIKDTFVPRKINLNEVSTYHLSKHPYVKSHLAQMVVGYRYDKGKYEKTEDLIEHRLITSVQHAKLKPYITVK